MRCAGIRVAVAGQDGLWVPDQRLGGDETLRTSEASSGRMTANFRHTRPDQEGELTAQQLWCDRIGEWGTRREESVVRRPPTAHQQTS